MKWFKVLLWNPIQFMAKITMYGFCVLVFATLFIVFAGLVLFLLLVLPGFAVELSGSIWGALAYIPMWGFFVWTTRTGFWGLVTNMIERLLYGKDGIA
jgi:hypothetical protein